MGSVRKASAWLGLVDDGDERYYDDESAGYATGVAAVGTGGHAWVTDARMRVVEADERAGDAGPAAGAAEVTRIATVTPESFRDARTVGELFRDGVPVIVNLTAMESADAKRVVDFAAGLTFGLRGSIDRIATRVFLLTPPAYEVVEADSAARRRDGFYNQS
ncbi:cell division protein SepF [Streptomyces sp. NPDC059740]|uniref:cell division protein SepF n=1 Tax=Streptomyces sp. NPDC059740 TaxID=3346926 RepID=UPI00364DC146